MPQAKYAPAEIVKIRYRDRNGNFAEKPARVNLVEFDKKTRIFYYMLENLRGNRTMKHPVYWKLYPEHELKSTKKIKKINPN